MYSLNRDIPSRKLPKGETNFRHKWGGFGRFEGRLPKATGMGKKGGCGGEKKNFQYKTNLRTQGGWNVYYRVNLNSDEKDGSAALTRM